MKQGPTDFTITSELLENKIKALTLEPLPLSSLSTFKPTTQQSILSLLTALQSGEQIETHSMKECLNQVDDDFNELFNAKKATLTHLNLKKVVGYQQFNNEMQLHLTPWQNEIIPFFTKLTATLDHLPLETAIATASYSLQKLEKWIEILEENHLRNSSLCQDLLEESVSDSYILNRKNLTLASKHNNNAAYLRVLSQSNLSLYLIEQAFHSNPLAKKLHEIVTRECMACTYLALNQYSEAEYHLNIMISLIKESKSPTKAMLINSIRLFLEKLIEQQNMDSFKIFYFTEQGSLLIEKHGLSEFRTDNDCIELANWFRRSSIHQLCDHELSNLFAEHPSISAKMFNSQTIAVLISDNTILNHLKKSLKKLQQTPDFKLTSTNNGLMVQMTHTPNTQLIMQIKNLIIHAAIAQKTENRTNNPSKILPCIATETLATVPTIPEKTVKNQPQVVVQPSYASPKPIPKKRCTSLENTSLSKRTRVNTPALIPAPILPNSPFALPVANAVCRLLNGARNIFICFNPTYHFIKPKKLDSTVEERFIKLLNDPQLAVSINDNGFKWIANENDPILVGKITTLPFRLFPSHKLINASGEMAFFYNEIRHTKSGKKSECYKAKLSTKP
ncbi:hypothetical protein [Candidatus Berkiella aquae]|uniref:Uncharacterized protein n=1 Tax=Candidatus Berkiella aquae TaxID=295108 RepID=A0A0Q9YVT6_9GAMM|nr:hypothetical protein [Candidatus Berkiella aquae]MCS5711554.1 hypothetical protein [Candidatus Berkiella aquae]